MDFLCRFGNIRPYVKIGMELFYSAGPDIVRKLKERGHKVFLDLKLHDIPNTVGKTANALSNLGADMINVHAAGGSAMMRAALEGVGDNTKIIAVTQLTSTSQEVMTSELLIEKPIADVVASYAANAKSSGLYGVVCSPLEAGTVHNICGGDFITVTPGIRFAGGDAGDQVRITTPEKAKLLGSDYIVVGRPITAADDPAQAYSRCVEEFTK